MTPVIPSSTAPANGSATKLVTSPTAAELLRRPRVAGWTTVVVAVAVAVAAVAMSFVE
jgi:hypothetical protein